MANKAHKTSIGGQALMEGIMMRGPKGSAVALRLPDGSIEVAPQEEKHVADSHAWAKWPVIRGCIAFFESLYYGYKYLMYSAEKTTLEDALEEESESKVDRWLNDHFGEKMVAAIGVISMVIGVALAMFLFLWLPMRMVDGFDHYISHGVLEAHRLHPLLEGLLKIVLLVLYMWAVSKYPDIKRVFMYHGAEHKTIFCYENGLELTVENVQKQLRFHPRCGTSFLIVLLLIGIFLYTALVFLFPGIGNIRWLWMLLKLLLLPLIMGLGYEFIKWAGRNDNALSRFMSAPGLWMQRITTVEPTDDMIEIGIAAFNAVRTENPEDDEIK